LNIETSLSLAQAAETSLIDYFTLFATNCPITDFGSTSGLRWRISDVPNRVFNMVLCGSLDPQEAAERIDGLLAEFATRGVPSAWWGLPSGAGLDLDTLLTARGFQYVGYEPGMAIELSALDFNVRSIPGLVIRPAADDNDLRVFAETMFPDSLELSRAYYGAYQTMGLAPDRPLRQFIASIEDVPAATAAILFQNGIAGLYSITTLPAYRQRGIGAAVTLAALWTTYEAGYESAVLQSTAMGESLYRRLGFQEVCRFPMYENGN